MNPISTCKVLGTPCAVTCIEEFIDTVRELAARESGAVCVDFTNVHVVAQRRVDSEFRVLTDTMDFFVPDSQVLVWAVRRLGGKASRRAYGPTFFRACIAAAPAPFTHYFLGASRDCLGKLQSAMLAVQPDLNIVGAHDGYFDPAEEEHIVGEINRLAPDFIWVGLGTPRQQCWMHRNRARIRRGVVMAVGFAFDVNAGTKPDAPAWMGRLGLTWLYRMFSEPRRLFWRYIKYNSIFLWHLAWQLIGRLFGRHSPPTTSQTSPDSKSPSDRARP